MKFRIPHFKGERANNIRHPIYTSAYILSIGLGLIFFAWFWFIVMIVFLPFWYLECREEEKDRESLIGD